MSSILNNPDALSALQSLTMTQQSLSTVQNQVSTGLKVATAADADTQCALLAHLKKIWREPDEGIWEVRGGRKQFTYSKIMAWVAFDRAVKSTEEFGIRARCRSKGMLSNPSWARPWPGTG